MRRCVVCRRIRFMETHVDIKSYAKINLFLNVLGRRLDGYHEIETILALVELSDVISIELAKSGIEFTSDFPGLENFSSSEKEWWVALNHKPEGGGGVQQTPCLPAKNLILRAAGEFFRRTGIRAGIKIHLQKRIPVGGGLGGGSSNGAATLLGLNRMFGFPLGREELFEIAASLGSDVPFFLRGGVALAKGRGEIIVALEGMDKVLDWVVLLLNPGFGISTPWAFKAYGQFLGLPNGMQGQASEFIEALKSGDIHRVAAKLYNSLEKPVLKKYPILELYKDFIISHGGVGALMSGSGSTVFGLFEDSVTAAACCDAALSFFGAPTFGVVTRFVMPGSCVDGTSV